jgi:hypothetical protein
MPKETKKAEKKVEEAEAVVGELAEDEEIVDDGKYHVSIDEIMEIIK